MSLRTVLRCLKELSMPLGCSFYSLVTACNLPLLASPNKLNNTHCRPGDGKGHDRHRRGLINLAPGQVRHVGAQGMLSHKERNGQLADDDGKGQQCPREQSYPQVGEDDLEADGGPARTQALGSLGERPDIHRSQSVVDCAEHVGKRKRSVYANEDDPRAVVGGGQQQWWPAVKADE